VVPSLYDVDSWKFLFCLDDEDFWMEGVLYMWSNHHSVTILESHKHTM
jgi:hypothetical protein